MKEPGEATPLGACIRIKHGYAFASEHFARAGRYKLLTPGNFNEAGGFRDLGLVQKYFAAEPRPDFILNEGDVLVAMTEQSPGLLGATLRVPVGGTYLHNQRLGLIEVLRPDLISKEYVYHLLNAPSVRKQISNSASGTKVKHTSPGKLCAIAALLPPLSQQKQIADCLFEWEVAIEKTERLLTANESRYQHELSRLFRARNQPAPLGMFLTESREPEANPHPARRLTVRLHVKGVEERKVRGTEGEGATVYYRRRAGQFIYGKQNIFRGAVGIVPRELDGYCSSQDLPAFDVAEQINPDWLLLWFARPSCYKQLEALAAGSGSKRLHPDELLRLRIGVPTRRVQDRVAAYLGSLQDEIGLLRLQAEQLRTQKSGLMQRLLTGQWRVPTTEEPQP